MKVSVIIPCYNSGPLLETTIESALSQSFRPHEILCHDDASTDDTWERLQGLRSRHGDVLRISHSDVNVRGINLRDPMIRRTQGDWIAFLDHDDVWLPGKLESQAELIRRHPAVEVTHTDGWNQVEDDSSTRTLQETPDYLGPADPHAALYFRNFILASAALFSRALCDRVGGSYSGDLAFIGDYELWLRMSRQGALFARVPQPLLVRRVLATGQLAVYRLTHLRVRILLFERYAQWSLAGPRRFDPDEARDHVLLARLDLIRALLETGDPAHRPEAAGQWRIFLSESGPRQRQRYNLVDLLALGRFGPAPAKSAAESRPYVLPPRLEAAQRAVLAEARRRAKRDPRAWSALIDETAGTILRFGLTLPFVRLHHKEASEMQRFVDRVWGELH